MLEAIRKRATGTVAKVLFLMLAASFVLWGIGDVFRFQGPSQTVARVGNVPITAAALRNEAELGYQDLARRVGGNLPRDQQIMSSLLREALQNTVTRRMIDAHARDLGVFVADPTLVDKVREQPSFQGPSGFDRARFDLFLRASGTDEPQFMEELRADIARGDLVGALLGGTSGSATTAKLLDAYRNERRSGQALVVESKAMTPPEPDETTLRAYLDTHAASFQAPELRTVELDLLEPADLAGQVTIEEADIAAEYAAKSDRFRAPEQRDAVQLVATDEAVILEATTKLAAGATMEQVASELAPRGLTRTELPGTVRGALPPSLEQALWALAPGQASAPVRSDFGWHLLRLDKVTPELVTPLADVRDLLADELRRRRAIDLLPDAATRLDDSLAAGSTLEDAAKEAGARHVTMTIDRAGLGTDGLTIAEPVLPARVLAEVFEAAPGETSLVRNERGEYYYVFAVREARPARPRTFDDARVQLEQAWRNEEQGRQAQAEARRRLDQAKGGKSLGELVAPGRRLVAVGPVARQAERQQKQLGEAAHSALFAASAGSVSGDPVAVPGGWAVLATTEVMASDTPADLAGMRDALRVEMTNDLAQSYEEALRTRYPARIDQAAMAALLPIQEPGMP